jgi:hypothetical protein
MVFVVTTALTFFKSWWWALPAALLGLLNIAAGFSGPSIRDFVHRKIERALSAMLE